MVPLIFSTACHILLFQSLLKRNGNRLEQAVIYDPTLDELFTASRGDGARLNNRRIRVSSRKSMRGASAIYWHSF